MSNTFTPFHLMPSDSDDTPTQHWHWEFLAHDGEEGQIVDIHWGVVVSVVGHPCEADALLSARDIVSRKTFVLRRVWECPSCGYHTKVVKAMEDIARKS